MNSTAPLVMPAGHHYAVTVAIGAEYGGMTNALLYRSKAMVEQTGTDVTVLTYEFDDYEVIRRDLWDRGAIVDGVHILNLYEDMRGWSTERLGTAIETSATTIDLKLISDGGFSPLGVRGDHADRFRNTLTNGLKGRARRIEQIDYFRNDGSLFLSEKFDVGVARDTVITLCDLSGLPIAAWGGEQDLLSFWLDSLPRDPIAWFIVDSKLGAESLVHYRRDDVVTMHVLHGSHLKFETKPEDREINPNRKYVLDRLDNFDGVVFMTQRQRADATDLLGPAANRFVCPNGRQSPTSLPDTKRDRNRGVMLARLDRGKQVDHAITAVANAGSRFRRPRLDVYGKGYLKKDLDQQIAADPKPTTVLRGYSKTAADEFASASFSLLTSKHEAFGLVIVESMALGCIPICYDMAYGPGEIITDGVDGFLVPQHDKEALADTIRKVTTMSRKRLAKIRVAANERAQDFNDANVTRRWIDIMDATLALKIAGSRTDITP